MTQDRKLPPPKPEGLRIVTLMENTAATAKLYHEHGLSFYLEFFGERLLLDTGASDRCFINARRMGFDMTEVMKAAITHNHHAHAGGLKALFRLNPYIKVYMKKASARSFYLKHGLKKHQVGLDGEFFKKHAKRFVLFESFQELSDGAYLVSCETFETDLGMKDKKYLIKQGRKYLPDDVTHEVFGVFFPKRTEEGGCVVVTGCAHCGILNVLETVRKNWPNAPILSVIGGFHLMGKNTNTINLPIDAVKILASELKKLVIGNIYVCHCVGQKGYELLRNELSDKVQYIQTGEELSFS